MKKFLMSVALMATVAVGYLMTDSNKSEAELTDLAAANIEALAQHITIGPICATGCDGNCECLYFWDDQYMEVEGSIIYY